MLTLEKLSGIWPMHSSDEANAASEFILADVETVGSQAERIIDCMAKSMPFGSKVKLKSIDDRCLYHNLLFKIRSDALLESESRAQGITDAEAESTFGAIESGNSIPLRPLEKIDILSTLSCCIVSESNMSILESKSIKIMALARIGLDEVGISYCDGSCKSDKSAGYSAAILAPGDSLGSASAESFTGRKMSCRILSGAIPNGTNNIGELSGVKCCIENFGGNTVQIINSDSAYAIGIFREWISRWKSNGFMTRSGKVSNCGLIKSIDSELGLSNKIVLFRWVEGHRGDHFNELCDEAAKEAAGA